MYENFLKNYKMGTITIQANRLLDGLLDLPKY